jgi:hypothetical protein
MRPLIESNASRKPHPGAEPIAYPLTQAQPEERVSGEVKLGKGPFSFSMPSMVAIAIVTTVGGFATSWLTKPTPGDAVQLASQIESKMAVLKQENATLTATLIGRLNGIETKVDRLQDSQDRMRERFNDELLNRYGSNKPVPGPLDNAISRQLAK